jgi:alanine-synthesizing transaminase
MPTPKHIVAKLVQAAQNGKNHRYSASKGITRLRVAMARWYKTRYDVDLDPNSEVIATIGAKEGMAHLALAVLQPGDGVLVPNPTYPIHAYSVVIADGDLRSVPLTPDGDFFARLEETAKLSWPKARMLILSFPHNPTTMCVDRPFFERVVDFAREHRLMVVHDFAYADFAYDGYRPPSFLDVPGAKEVGVEIFSTSKSYNMPGWRLGFVCGNASMIHALARIKSYLDYGAFQPIQIAGIIALEGDQRVVHDIVEVHRKRRDVLVNGLNKIGWTVEKPKGTMFVWAPIPEPYRSLGSLEFAKLCVEEAKVAVSPGIGFGEYGEGYVRFALVENEQRIRQAVRGLKSLNR